MSELREKMIDLMARWPASWCGVDKDLPVGQGLVEELAPFVEHLVAKGLATKTVRNHVNNLWVIGGEIIRDFSLEPEHRSLPLRELLLEAVEGGEAPLIHSASEAEQRSCDATARKLLEWMQSAGRQVL